MQSMNKLLLFVVLTWNFRLGSFCSIGSSIKCPKFVLVKPRQKLDLTCNLPGISYKFYKQDQEITPNTAHYRLSGKKLKFDNHKITIHTDIYKCQATASDGSVKTYYWVVSMANVDTTLPPHQQELKLPAGTNHVFDCSKEKIYNTLFKSNSLNGSKLKITGRDNKKGIIVLPVLTISDTGYYFCGTNSTDKGGLRKYSKNVIHLIVTRGVLIRRKNFGEDHYYVKGDKESFRCEITGSPLSISWHKGNQTMNNVLKSFVNGETKLVLTLNDVDIGDEGDYWCEVIFQNGSGTLYKVTTLKILAFKPAIFSGGDRLKEISDATTSMVFMYCRSNQDNAKYSLWRQPVALQGKGRGLKKMTVVYDYPSVTPLEIQSGGDDGFFIINPVTAAYRGFWYICKASMGKTTITTIGERLS